MWGTKVGIRLDGYLDINDIMEIFGIGKSSAWKLVYGTPNFPPSLRFGRRTVRWNEGEVMRWRDSCREQVEETAKIRAKKRR